MEENKNLMANEQDNKENENTNEETVVTETKGIVAKATEFVTNNKKPIIAAGIAVVGAIVLGKYFVKSDSVVQELVESTEVMDTVTDVVKDIVEDVVTPE